MLCMGSRRELGDEGRWTYVMKKGFLFVCCYNSVVSIDKTGNLLNCEFLMLTKLYKQSYLELFSVIMNG